ncbi:MAG: hypothetical protein QW816_02535 [Desulfurococcaceae archaeon]
MISTRSYCEIYTKKILPAVKAYIACLLVKEYGVPQLRVAKLLDMAQPAVNYIVTGRRRLKCVDLVEKCPELRNLLNYYAMEIYNGAAFDPCIICEKITRNDLLLKSILNILGEKDITGRSCLAGPLGQ